MALICDICEQEITWREILGKRVQPHGTVNVKKPKIKCIHCFNHSIDEVNLFIKKVVATLMGQEFEPK